MNFHFAMYRFLIFILRRVLTLLIFTLTATQIFGQFSKTISTDRPGQANGAFGVGKRILQFQTGPEGGGAKVSNTSINTAGLLWPVTIRYGITEKVELRLNTAYSNLSTENVIAKSLSGIATTMIGVRANIIDGKSGGPAIGGLFDLGINGLISDDFKRDHTFATLMVIAQQSLSDKSAVTVNLSTVWAGFGDSKIWPYVLNYSYSITDRLGLIVEHYGEFYEDGYRYNFDAGLGWLLSPDLLVDMAFGGGRGDKLETWFINAGMSWRFVKWLLK